MVRKLKLLRLQLVTNSSSAPYNNFTLNSLSNYKIFTVTYKSEIPKNELKSIFYDSLGSIWNYLRAIKEILKNNKIDIIHIHSVHCGFFLILYCFLYNNYSILKKTILTVHNSFNNYKTRNKVLFFLNYFFLNKIVFCSNSSFNSFPKLILGNKKNNVIINGADLKKMDRHKSIKFDQRAIDFVIVGRMEKVKNIILLSKILSLFNNKKIHFIGTGSLYPSVKKILNEDNVYFHGHKERNEVYKILSNSKYFISLSKTEGLPIALLESIYLGCIPIVSKIKPHLEILNQFPVLFLPIKKNTNNYKNQINSYICQNVSKLDKKKLRNYVVENYSLESMLEHYNNLYNDMLNEV